MVPSMTSPNGCQLILERTKDVSEWMDTMDSDKTLPTHSPTFNLDCGQMAGFYEAFAVVDTVGDPPDPVVNARMRKLTVVRYELGSQREPGTIQARRV
ncbi:hypothetical protein CTheo_3926 [Ceratobasidium theobromae]|uniref:Uncharacterized protein n=1 Tax=Ceratobasidium theobromae TaxID=1582974 RepID=A0A5N5QLK7_9AGAM|nr:hypothetical protein CTheo_3926 [Ceratobasidium theobromae]